MIYSAMLLTTFVLDYMYWNIKKPSEDSLESLSGADAFFPILEAWPALLLLPVSMETDSGP